jgi:hypothetical protein
MAVKPGVSGAYILGVDRKPRQHLIHRSGLKVSGTKAEAKAAAYRAEQERREREAQRERKQFLDDLARRHARLFGLPIEIAERHVNAVAVSARRESEN